MEHHIALSSNTAWNLYNFRGNLIRYLINEGYRVSVLAPPDVFSLRLAELGCTVIDLPMDNKGTNPWRDYQTLRDFKRIYRQIRPDIVMHYTIKPVVYGSLAARSLRIPVINTITGLGTAFLRKGWLMRLVERLYRVSQRWPAQVFFQNRDDHELFINRDLVDIRKTECLPGSGVDLTRFNSSPYPNEQSSIIFLLMARMLRDKGVGEFVKAARQLKTQFPRARFQLLGPLGVANPTAIPSCEMTIWAAEGLVEYFGETDDVRPFVAASHCVVLPSYREGTPKSLLEAAAMARPIITTDTPGCRDVVDQGVNGLLCRVQDAEDLTAKMTDFIQLSPEKRRQMGLAGRKKMDREFDEQKVIARYVRAIKELL